MQVGLLEAIELFLIAKQIEAKSPKAIRWYQYLLAHFEHVGNYEGFKLLDVLLDAAREFVATLQARTLRAYSILRLSSKA